MNNAYIYDFPVGVGAPTSGTVAATTASASTTLPLGIETVILITTAPIHFRFTIGASAAVQADPILVSGMSPVVVKLPQNNTGTGWTLSVICDTGTTAANVNWAKVAEA